MTLKRKQRGRQDLLNEVKARECLERAVATFAKETIRPHFYDVVSDWKTEIKFKVVAQVQPPLITASVVPYGKNEDIYRYVDEGTKPHKIRPKRKFVRNKAATLAFQWGGPGSYKPRTLPVARAHVGPGQVVGGALTFALEVDHPGTEARQFSVAIEKKVTPEFRRFMEREFQKIAREANG